VLILDRGRKPATESIPACDAIHIARPPDLQTPDRFPRVSPSLSLPPDEQLPPEIRSALANLPPLNVFRAVAAVPASFRPFLELGGSLLAGKQIDPKNREIAILGVARETGASYEWAQHEQLARNVGVSATEIEAIRDRDRAGLDDDGALALRAAIEISRDVRISDQALALLIGRWGEAGAAELILCISYYNMVSRFLESAGVEIEPEQLLGDRTPAEIRDHAT
jgi:4-carboxymuconolactone decarboxylase